MGITTSPYSETLQSAGLPTGMMWLEQEEIVQRSRWLSWDAERDVVA